MKKSIDTPALKSWIALNDALRDSTEGFCKILIKQELKGKKRKTFVNRIHARLNKVRADREREELGGKL